MSADAPVLVVGAGPTGLLLAAELHRRGVGCRLIDAAPGPMPWDRATVVHPRSLEVFESLGLLEAFLEAGVKQRMARLHSDGDVLGEIGLSTCGSRHGFNLGLSEEVTESILTDYLRRQGGDVVRSHRLTRLETRPDGVVAVIEGDHSTEHASFQWVVGCDGIHSITRQMGGIELAGHDIPEPWAVFDSTAAGWSESFEGIYVYLDTVPVILTALPDRRWRAYLRPASPDSDLVADASATIRRYHPEVTLEDVTNPRRFHCHTRIATRFRSDRVLLAGDAAHVCSPFEGHGMNSGLQDAFNLAWKLALVCQGHAGSGLLDSYEAERRPVAEKITRSGDAVEHAQTLTDPVERRARDETFRAMFADPRARHQDAIAEAELDIDYGSSPIVLGETNAVLHPGQRLPDTLPVALDGTDGWLHELTNRSRHTALILGGPSAHAPELERLRTSARAAGDPSLIEETIVGSAGPGGREPWARLGATTVADLDIGDVTVLVVRPDGYVGLRADHDHLDALAAYQGVLRSRT